MPEKTQQGVCVNVNANMSKVKTLTLLVSFLINPKNASQANIINKPTTVSHTISYEKPRR